MIYTAKTILESRKKTPRRVLTVKKVNRRVEHTK